MPGPHFRKDIFVWMPDVAPKVNPIDICGGYSLEDHGLRAHYFTAMAGDDLALTEMRDIIRGCGFHAEVFKKRDGKAKQVDMALTVRAIAEAAKGSYEIAVLIAGDEDYVPLVNAASRSSASPSICRSSMSHAAA